MKGTKGWMMSRFLVGSSVVIVALLGLLLSVPSPPLDWDDIVLPMARNYMIQHFHQDATVLSTDQQPLKGLTVAITGATSGIGLGLTRTLARLGATIIAIGRSPAKLQRLREELPSATIETVVADCSDLESIAQASQNMVERFDHIDVLVNNAGIHTAFHGIFQKFASPQGYDLPFTVNYLSHFLLTEKLLPLLRRSKHPKIVQVSSRFHWAVDGSDLSTRGGTDDPVASRIGGNPGFGGIFRSQRQYGNSKFAQLLHARAVVRHQNRHHNRHDGDDTTTTTIRAVSACPTWVATEIGTKNGTMAHALFAKLAFPMDGFGLSSILHALLDADHDREGGRGEDVGDDEDEDDDFYVNTDFGTEGNSNPVDLLPSWTYHTVPIRDVLVAGAALTGMLWLQKFFVTRKVGRSSKLSYNQTLQEELYTWSKQAVSPWL